MAPVSSLHSNSLLLSHSHLQKDLRRNKNPNIIFCCKNNALHQKIVSCEKIKEECGKRRRELLFQALSAAVALPAMTSVALAADAKLPAGFRVYTDEVNKYKIAIPQDWQVGTGEGDGVRSLFAFYPQEASSSNVSIVITPLGADFTRLESFGKVDAFAENLVSGFDRSWQRPPGVAAKLIDSKSANGLYYVEYTLKSPGDSRRHLFTVLGIANNGYYNRLYTLTGQFVDEEEEKFGSMIQKINLMKDIIRRISNAYISIFDGGAIKTSDTVDPI